MRNGILILSFILICRSVFAGILVDINTAYNIGFTSRAPEGAAYSGVALGFGAGYGFTMARFGLSVSNSFDLELGIMLDYKYQMVRSADIPVFDKVYNRIYKTGKASLIIEPLAVFELGRSFKIGLGFDAAPGLRLNTSFTLIKTNAGSVIDGNLMTLSLSPLLYMELKASEGIGLIFRTGYEFELFSVTAGYPLLINGFFIDLGLDFKIL